MPVRSGRADKSVLVFDAFVRLSPETPLVACWPEAVAPESDERDLLDALLDGLGFLGRAESWVEAQRIDGTGVTANCHPGQLGVETTTGEAFEPVRLIAPLPAEEYTVWRERVTEELDWQAMKPKARRQIQATLPTAFLDALRLETGTIQAAGWNQPPGARYLTYQRPADVFTPQRLHSRRSPDVSAPSTTVRLALAGRPLPRIEDAVRIGELVRLAAIKQSDRLTGTRGSAPPVLSGHDMPEGNCHGHAFYLPEANATGRIEHVLVHAPAGLSDPAIRVLHALRRIWTRDGGQEWETVLELYGGIEAFAHSALVAAIPARQWRSVTPYLHPWHRKKRLTIADQLRRECRKRGLPEPVSVEPESTVTLRGRECRPVHFHRFRSRRGLHQPDTQGSFWRLAFEKPLTGPLALGFGCHYGLGMFQPV